MMARVVLLLIFSIFAGSALGEESPEFFIKEGNDLFLKMDYDKAISSYGKGIEAFPDEPILYYDRGNAYQKKGEIEKAVSDYLLAEKKNPRKILLKNIYFNLGNAYYTAAEKSRNSSSGQIEPLKNALSEYEKARDAYRKSLEIERELAIKTHTDFATVGAYAQKNMALTKEAWTETFEQINLLERKNLKLEDGIENLMNAQMDLLPHLEKAYLNSSNDDMLAFNLKTLAQYHVDAREDIVYLREIAEKEIERANAELSNHNASATKPQPQPQSQSPQGGAGQGAPAEPPDDTVQKLEEALKNAKEIKRAVDQAAGLSEWVIDGLNTKKPLDAFRNNYLMIALLKNLCDYLKKKDAVLSSYHMILKQLAETDMLLSRIKNDPAPSSEPSIGYDSPGSRMRKLSQEKLDAALKGIFFINEHLEKMGETLSKPPETKGNGDPGAPGQTGGDDSFAPFFQSFERKAAASVLSRSKALNLSVQERIKSFSSKLLTETLSEETPLESMMADTMTALKFYEAAPRPLIEILVDTYRKVKELNRAMDQTTDDKKVFVGHRDFSPFELMEVLLFKYEMLLSDEFKKPLQDLGVDMERLGGNLSALKSAHASLLAEKKIDPKAAADPDTFRKLSIAIEDEVLTGLCLIVPEVAASLFFESLKHTLETGLSLLPGTQENIPQILKVMEPVKGDLSRLKAILEPYFKDQNERAQKQEKAAQRDPMLKSLEHRKMALSYLERGDGAYEKMKGAYASQKRLSGDVLLKDLKDSLEKAQMVFSGKPDSAVEALKSAIAYQKALKESAQTAIDIKTQQERGEEAFSPALADHQKDIQMFSGVAAMKIREMPEAGDPKEKEMVPQNGQLPTGATCPKSQGIDPAKRDEALNLVQDAMIEEEKIRAFLEALEYHNTFEKHDLVIETLEKALSILENKEDQKGENPDKNKDEGKNSENNKNQEQDQKNQNGQGGGQKEAKPLELTPDQARELLNELNKSDSGKQPVEAETGRSLNVPRPW